MKHFNAHICIDCNYVGRLLLVGDRPQCPQCASRATWPLSAFSKMPIDELPFHQSSPSRLKRTCCDVTPGFLGGQDGT